MEKEFEKEFEYDLKKIFLQKEMIDDNQNIEEEKSTPIQGLCNVFCHIKEEKWKSDRVPNHGK